MERWQLALAGLMILLAGGLGIFSQAVQGGDKKAEQRVFEMRTYYVAPGKMDALHARFREHTNKLFEKHGMTLIGYWTPIEAKDQKLVFILAYPSKAAADKSWKAFINDEDWKKAKAASEKDGPLVTKYESVYLNPADYSPIK